jgi:hypothetical protein
MNQPPGGPPGGWQYPGQPGAPPQQGQPLQGQVLQQGQRPLQGVPPLAGAPQQPVPGQYWQEQPNYGQPPPGYGGPQPQYGQPAFNYGQPPMQPQYGQQAPAYGRPPQGQPAAPAFGQPPQVPQFWQPTAPYQQSSQQQTASSPKVRSLGLLIGLGLLGLGGWLLAFYIPAHDLSNLVHDPANLAAQVVGGDDVFAAETVTKLQLAAGLLIVLGIVQLATGTLKKRRTE